MRAFAALLRADGGVCGEGHAGGGAAVTAPVVTCVEFSPSAHVQHFRRHAGLYARAVGALLRCGDSALPCPNE